MYLSAKDFAEQISLTANDIQDEFNRISKLVSKTDIATQDILHKIEFSEFSEEEAFIYALQIKAIRQERRTYKNEIEILTILKSVLDINKINKAVKKINSRYKGCDKLPAVSTEMSLEEVTNKEDKHIHNNDSIQNDIECKKLTFASREILFNEQCDKPINHAESNLKQKLDDEMKKSIVFALRQMAKRLKIKSIRHFKGIS
jgi:hypothetical protein